MDADAVYRGGYRRIYDLLMVVVDHYALYLERSLSIVVYLSNHQCSTLYDFDRNFSLYHLLARACLSDSGPSLLLQVLGRGQWP